MSISFLPDGNRNIADGLHRPKLEADFDPAKPPKVDGPFAGDAYTMGPLASVIRHDPEFGGEARPFRVVTFSPGMSIRPTRYVRAHWPTTKEYHPMRGLVMLVGRMGAQFKGSITEVTHGDNLVRVWASQHARRILDKESRSVESIARDHLSGLWGAHGSMQHAPKLKPEHLPFAYVLHRDARNRAAVENRIESSILGRVATESGDIDVWSFNFSGVPTPENATIFITTPEASMMAEIW